MQCSGSVSVFAIVSVVWNAVVFSHGVQNCFAVNFCSVDCSRSHSVSWFECTGPYSLISLKYSP